MKNGTFQLLAIFAVLIIAASRLLLIDIANIAPIAAAGIFSAFYIQNKKLSIILPLVALFVTDIIVHANTGYGLYTARIVDYIGFALAILFAQGMFSQKKNVASIVGSILGGSIIFFILSNFGVWLFDTTMYSKTLGGLLHCYEMGLPFYRATFLGDLLFTGVFFFGFELLKQSTNQTSLLTAK